MAWRNTFATRSASRTVASSPPAKTSAGNVPPGPAQTNWIWVVVADRPVSRLPGCIRRCCGHRQRSSPVAPVVTSR